METLKGELMFFRSVLVNLSFISVATLSVFVPRLEAVEAESFFPIGVYYVMGQKSAHDLRDDVTLENDIRYNSTVAYNEYLNEFQDLKNYGFNTAIMSIDFTLNQADATRSYNIIDSVIRASEDSGLNIVPAMSDTQTLLDVKDADLTNQTIVDTLNQDHIQQFKYSNNILGYAIYDEPVPLGEAGILGPDWKEIDENQLGMVKDTISTIDQDAISLCAFNNIESMNTLNQAMNPDVILMDAYPFALDYYNGDQADGDTPLGDLSDYNPRGNAADKSFKNGGDQLSIQEVLSQAQDIAQGKPIWFVLQAFGGDTYWRSPIPKELRLQTFVAIKEGAKGIFYFMYQSEDWADGMMDINYEETPLIKEAQSINEKLNALAPTLLKLNLTDGNFAQSTEAEVQTFTHDNGDKYFIAVNPDVQNAQTVTIKIEKSWLASANNAVDIYNNENFTITSLNADFFQVSLPIDTADGVVLHLNGAVEAPLIYMDVENYISNEAITIQLANLPAGNGDWVGIYPVGSSNDWGNVVSWSYTNGTHSMDGAGIHAGSLVLEGVGAGEYEARLFLNNSFVVEDLSSFVVNESRPIIDSMDHITYNAYENITVNVSGLPAGNGDWVGIYPVGSSNDWGNVVSWSYTNGTHSMDSAGIHAGSLVLEGVGAGEYEARLFLNNSFVVEDLSPFVVNE